MNEPLKWLPDGNGTPWKALGDAMLSGLPVPAGYVVFSSTPETDIRVAYEKLKVTEKTHFLAVRSSPHAALNVIGPDPLVHSLRRLWATSPDSPILVQRMVHAMWSGKAQRHRENLRIKANEGMMVLDPDTYLVNIATGKCTRRTLELKQRKMIRYVDGTTRVVEREGERRPIPDAHLVEIAKLASLAGTDIAWAIDDRDRVWLVDVS
jgi:hypothetical protein